MLSTVTFTELKKDTTKKVIQLCLRPSEAEPVIFCTVLMCCCFIYSSKDT